MKTRSCRWRNSPAEPYPRADGVGVTLIEEGRADTIVATDSFVTEMDAVQYWLKQGPCISAVVTRQPVISDSSHQTPARAKIRAISQSEHRKIDVVAQNIVDTVVRLARARRIG